MPPAKDPREQPITAAHRLFKGEDKTLSITVFDRTTQAVKDITGWTMSWVLSATQGSAALVTKAGTIATGTDGVVTIAIAAADTSGLTAGTLWYSLSRTDAGANAVCAYGDVVLQAR